MNHINRLIIATTKNVDMFFFRKSVAIDLEIIGTEFGMLLYQH